MTTSEFFRLKSYWTAKKHAPKAMLLGRRIAKGRGKHVGFVLKSSAVKPQIPL